MVQQLPLQIRLQDEATLANFYSGGNEQVLSCLSAFIAGQSNHYVYLWGQTGVGRTHLLQACCHAVGERGASMIYIPLSQYQQLSPAILENVEQAKYVYIDDIHCVVGDTRWERALFNAYNTLEQHKRRLAITADRHPSALPFTLPDLQSRLSSGLIFSIQRLSDDQMIAAITLRAVNRGLMLSSEVSAYLVHHYPRNMKILIELLSQLDNASLAMQRPITIPFVKQVLKKH